MKDSLYIAWKYICYHRGKSLTLVVCVALIAVLPLVLELLLGESQRQLMSRAEKTPLVVGAKGSALDLVMNTLYFDDERPETISMQAAKRVEDSELALAIPTYVRFEARGYPIVGTTLDYFEHRKLEVSTGRSLATLGEAVVGSTVARELGISAGDSLTSSPESVFNIAGVYPLKMKVVGVLEPSHSSDDLGVFVDIKTAWVIQGLGHGHDDLKKVKDGSVLLGKSEQNITANAKLEHFSEITEENINSFHFHGDTSDYPITAVIAIPNDTKSEAILRGRFLESGETLQVLVPQTVIDGLLQNIFRIRNVLDGVIGVVALATVMAMILVFMLSLRLRKREIETVHAIGCSPSTVAKLLGAEIGIIGVASATICVAVMFLCSAYSPAIVRALFIG